LPDNHQYTTGLSEYVDKKIVEWQDQKKKELEKKFQKNFEAVTGQDFRDKKWKKKEGEGWRSDTMIGFIRVKIWTLYSVFLDTVLPGGQIPFDLKPDPYESEDLPEEYIEDRDTRLEKMRDKMNGQLKQRKADREYMKKWLSLSYYGMGFSKFDVDEIITKRFTMMDTGMEGLEGFVSPEESSEMARFEMVQEAENVPGHRYVSVWNMCWDMEVDNLQEGEGYAERIPTSLSDLNDLKEKPGYEGDRIDSVIDEGRGKVSSNEDLNSLPPGERSIQERKKNIIRYEYYMKAPLKLVQDYEENLDNVTSLGNLSDYAIDLEEENTVEIMGEIADKQIIRHIRNETGKRRTTWRSLRGTWTKALEMVCLITWKVLFRPLSA